MNHPDKFKRVFDSPKPHEEELPIPWNKNLDEFEKLLVLKAIRMDKVLSGIESWISVKLGKQFIIPPTFDLPKCYKDSCNLTPLIFMLSPGSDPVTDFIKFAKEMDKKTESISLGQGQGPKAQELVRSGELKGTWILLQNCHLAASWMP
jgi:dynein heavy chain